MEVAAFEISQVSELTKETIEAAQRLYEWEITQEHLQQVVTTGVDTWLLARDKSSRQIVGMALVVVYPVLTNVRTELSNMVVDPAYRRRGVAKLLLTAAIEEAKARGANWLRLAVEPNNSGAIALYESMGFTLHPYRHYRYPLS